jgi:glyoxylase-like metal-dependent hydrolase (beta-lactamase superfamily II)
MIPYEIKITEPAPGIFRIPIPVPLPLKFVYAYAVIDSRGVWIIDLGMDVPEARQAWHEANQSLGLDRRGVAGVIITHYHPDHIGLAAFAHELWHAPIYMLAGEIASARQLFEDQPEAINMADFLRKNGAVQEDILLLNHEAVARRTIVRLPSELVPLHDLQDIVLGDTTLKIFQQSGHTDHQAVVYDKTREVLFCGDQILSRITPNISLWPNADPNPLASYFASLKSLKHIKVAQGLPAHEHLIEDLNARIDAIVAHHFERSEEVMQLLDHPQTGYQVAKRLFKRPLNPYQMRFALSETLAHLEYLRLSQRIDREDSDLILYHKP